MICFDPYLNSRSPHVLFQTHLKHRQKYCIYFLIYIWDIRDLYLFSFKQNCTPMPKTIFSIVKNKKNTRSLQLTFSPAKTEYLLKICYRREIWKMGALSFFVNFFISSAYLIGWVLLAVGLGHNRWICKDADATLLKNRLICRF